MPNFVDRLVKKIDKAIREPKQIEPNVAAINRPREISYPPLSIEALQEEAEKKFPGYYHEVSHPIDNNLTDIDSRSNISEGRSNIEYAKLYFEFLKEHGLIAVYGKMKPADGDDPLDYGPLAISNGQISKLEARRISDFVRSLLPMRTAFGTLEPGYADHTSMGAGLFYAITSLESTLKPVLNKEDMTDKDNSAIVNNLKKITKFDKIDKIGTFIFKYLSPDRTRGHEIRAELMMMLPASVAEQLKVDLKTYPWFIKILSDVILEEVKADFDAKKTSTFKFPWQYENFHNNIFPRGSNDKKLAVMVESSDVPFTSSATEATS